MYAVLFDFDTNCFDEHYDGITYNRAYKLVKDFMMNKGFTWKQGGLYFGTDKIDAVGCVLAIQKLAEKYAWFSAFAIDVRMLRIEENNDLFPAIS